MNIKKNPKIQSVDSTNDEKRNLDISKSRHGDSIEKNDLSDSFYSIFSSRKVNNPDFQNNAIGYIRVATMHQSSKIWTRKYNYELFCRTRGLNMVSYFGGIHESDSEQYELELERMVKFIYGNRGRIRHLLIGSDQEFSKICETSERIFEYRLPKFNIHIIKGN